jgi:hypothetical protein
MRPLSSVKTAAIAAAACGSLATWSGFGSHILSDHGARASYSKIMLVGDRLAQALQPSMDATESVLDLRRDQLQGPLKERDPRWTTDPRGATSAESECRDTNHPGQDRISGNVPCESPAGERPDR